MARKVEAFDAMASTEESFFDFDFDLVLAEDETIEGTPTVEFDPPGELAVAGSPEIREDGTVVRVKLGGGTAGTKYFVTVTATTSTGQVLPRTTSVAVGEDNRPLT